MYSKVDQLYICIYPLFFRFFSHISHYRALSRSSLCYTVEFYFILFYLILYFSFHFIFWPHGRQDLTSPTRDGTCAPCSGSTKSQPLDCQGIPYFIYSSVYMSIPISKFISPPFPSGNHNFVFYICDSVL